MDQEFARKYSEDHLSNGSKNPVIVALLFIGYIATIYCLWLILGKCFKCCIKKPPTNHLQYEPLILTNPPVYQNSNLV